MDRLHIQERERKNNKRIFPEVLIHHIFKKGVKSLDLFDYECACNDKNIKEKNPTLSRMKLPDLVS